jgi:hypothetical protein
MRKQNEQQKLKEKKIVDKKDVISANKLFKYAWDQIE